MAGRILRQIPTWNQQPKSLPNKSFIPKMSFLDELQISKLSLSLSLSLSASIVL